jgi:hypothetical protein
MENVLNGQKILFTVNFSCFLRHEIFIHGDVLQDNVHVNETGELWCFFILMSLAGELKQGHLKQALLHLLHKLEKWCIFLSHVKAKLSKMRPACVLTKEERGPEISFYHSFSKLVTSASKKSTPYILKN